MPVPSSDRYGHPSMRFRSAVDGVARDTVATSDAGCLSLFALPFAAALFDGDDRVVAVNTAFVDLYRIPAAFVQAGTSSALIAPYRAAARERARTLQALAPLSMADDVVAADDGWLYLAQQCPVAGVGLLLTHQEITAFAAERRAHDELLRAAEARAEIAERAEARLREAFDLLPEGVVILDKDDRCVFWNRHYADYIHPGDDLAVGATFESVLRAGLAHGHISDAVGREEDWLRARLLRHRRANNTDEQRTSDGRWVRVEERRTASGGSVGVRTDITALKQREESLRLLFDGNPVPLVVVHRESGRILAVNDEAVVAYGHTRPTLVGRSIADLWLDDDQTALQVIVDSTRSRETTCVAVHRRADGSTMTVRLFARDLVHDGKEAVILSIVDITDLGRVENDLRRTRAFLDSVVESIPLTIFVKDIADDSRYILFNRAAEILVQRPRTDFLGRTDDDLFEPADAARYRKEDRAAIADGRVLRSEEDCDYAGNGEIRTVFTTKLAVSALPGEGPRYVLGIQEDITERRRIEKRLARMAHFDALTDLANRVLLHEMLETALGAGVGGAIYLIDLDRFKEVNDTLGHQVGDALLAEMGRRLRTVSRSTDCPARLGGDEFAVLQTPLANVSEAEAFAARLVALLSEPFHVDGVRLPCSASIGVALVDDGVHDVEDLLRRADLALYAAKASGRRGYCLFGQEATEEERAARRLDRDLRAALGSDQFVLHYQPIVAMADGAITGYEALLRWNHPERGLLGPGAFLPAAEAIGLMVPLGEWVLRTACAEAASWAPHLRVSVNVSPTQIQAGTFAAVVADALAATRLKPGQLDIELTESVLMAANDRNAEMLHALRALGVGLSLDDFGTGYSPLTYLRMFPVDRIKIDQSFVRDLETSRDCLAIVRAVVGLGSSLGLAIVAEGVETAEQLARLKAEGCDEVQGYFIGRPAPMSDTGRLARDIAA